MHILWMIDVLLQNLLLQFKYDVVSINRQINVTRIVCVSGSADAQHAESMGCAWSIRGLHPELHVVL